VGREPVIQASKLGSFDSWAMKADAAEQAVDLEAGFYFREEGLSEAWDEQPADATEKVDRRAGASVAEIHEQIFDLGR
jgi:hypothetical protein